MEKEKQAPSDPQNPEESQSHGVMNCLKLLFLVSILVGAWFLLDWLING